MAADAGRTRFLDGKDHPLLPWDITIDWNKSARERLLAALVACKADLTDSHALAPLESLGPRGSVFLRIHIAECRLARFREIAQPYRMTPAPVARVGVVSRG